MDVVVCVGHMAYGSAMIYMRSMHDMSLNMCMAETSRGI